MEGGPNLCNTLYNKYIVEQAGIIVEGVHIIFQTPHELFKMGDKFYIIENLECYDKSMLKVCRSPAATMKNYMVDPCLNNLATC